MSEPIKVYEPALCDHIADCATLGATTLRQRYKGEAISHQNMLQRAKDRGAIIHPYFREFRSFLRIVGPKPSPQATPDRIDNSNPMYGPGLVAWADKRTQNSNKGDSLIFRQLKAGKTYTTSQLAKHQGVSPSTIRQRLRRGWTDDEIIAGQRIQAASPEVVPTSVPKAVPKSVPKALPKSGREIQFERNRYSAEQHRKMYGEEYCIAGPDDMLAIMGDDWTLGPLTDEFRERWITTKFDRWWQEWQPHVIREKLPAWAQEAIARLERA